MTMYHVTGTVIIISLLYLTSLFFHRSGIYSLYFHRMLWNSILALSFLFTALAGIFMALRINYNWDIPFAEQLLDWHVETGVAMGLTGIFHLIWHLSYFRNIFHKASTNQLTNIIQGIRKPIDIRANLFMVGFVSTAIQILLIRELMNITGGYELIGGVFLASWLITSAAGAAIGGKSSLNNLKKINLLFAISPCISIVLLLTLSRLFLHTGEVPAFLAGMILTLIILFPFCVISGFTFVRLLNIAKELNNFSPGRSFAIETAGGISSGIVLTLLTSGIINTWKLLLLILLLFLAYVILSLYVDRKGQAFAIKLLFTAVISVIVISEPDILFRQFLIPSIHVTSTKDTPYGNITTGEYSGELSVWYNHVLHSYPDDAIEREENIHFAMLQADDPEAVLLISGKAESHIPEILKYDVNRITYIERDPYLAKNAKEIMDTGSSAVINVENRDAFSYIRKTKQLFDVIIMLLPPPSTLSLNRYYTYEFFSDLKKRLSPGGVFMCSPGPNDYYLNRESVNLYSSVFKSLGASFGNIIPVAGNKLFFIASDKDVSVAFSRLVSEKGINNLYVNSGFLSDDLTESKSAEIKALMDPDARMNLSTHPVACFHFQSYNFSKNLTQKIPAILLMIAAFLLPLPAVRRRNMLMYFSAASLAGYEIIVLLALQIVVGNMYQMTGLVIAVMMSGLAAGAGIGVRGQNAGSLKPVAFLLILYYLPAAFSFSAVAGIKSSFIPGSLILLSVLPPAFVTGYIFRTLTGRKVEKTPAGETYSADLAGSALGFILLSGVAVPVLGISNSIILLSVFMFTGMIFAKKS
ncbi:MAG TPA: hypothetical protein P5180_12295 [Bacteroidales bacterium]|nr:hypothetical protein [Bacteroidales bacterium]